jgi:hypothetical protein
VIEVRSYRRVFDLERRIYRVDRFRLNPGGLPLRGLAYLIVGIALVTVAARVPGVRWLLAVLPWYLTYVALPVTASALLAVISIEGRPFHVAAVALMGIRRVPRVGSRTSCRTGWRPPDLIVLPNGDDAHMRALLYRGPGIAVVAVAHRRTVRSSSILGRLPGCRARRAELVLNPSTDADASHSREVITLSGDVRLRVCSHPAQRSAGGRAHA